MRTPVLAVLIALPCLAEPTELESRASAATINGRAWLAAQQRKEGTFPGPYQTPGMNALAMWTILECGARSSDPVVLRTLEWLRENGDPTETPEPYGNYAASMTLVALWKWHDRKASETGGNLRELVSKEDRRLVERLVRYVRACSGGTGWSYRKLQPPLAKLIEAPAAKDVAPFEPPKATPEPPMAAFQGDNSNAQYGWLGLRAASHLGVALDDSGWILDEVRRLVGTRVNGDPVDIALEREGTTGFSALWPSPSIQGRVPRGGWAYSSGTPIPTMTVGCLASLVYAWQEAEERGLMTDDLRAQSREALLGGVAELYDTRQEQFPDC